MGITNAIIDIKDKFHREGLYSALKYNGFLIQNSLYKNLLHKSLSPSLFELYKIAKIQTTKSMVLSKELQIDKYDSEFQEVFNVFMRIKRKTKLNYPLLFKINIPEARILYEITRKIKPKIFVESGVADGTSSFFILSAIKKNGFGKLISIDIRDNVGSIIPNDLRPLWELKILKGNLTGSFKQIMSELPNIGVFFHDSDHSYNWQQLEYNIALKKLTRDGLLLIDDADSSYALIDLIKENQNNVIFTLVTNRKVFSIIKR